MRLFTCGHCGQWLYFEKAACIRCGASLGFLPGGAQLLGRDEGELIGGNWLEKCIRQQDREWAGACFVSPYDWLAHSKNLLGIVPIILFVRRIPSHHMPAVCCCRTLPRVFAMHARLSSRTG